MKAHLIFMEIMMFVSFYSQLCLRNGQLYKRKVRYLFKNENLLFF